MLKINDEQLESVRNQLASANPMPVGYRLIIRPLPATEGLEAAEEAQYATLNRIAKEKGTTLATKTDNEKDRQSHGSDVGVVVGVGPDSYKVGMLKDCDPWVKEGDVVIFKRYCGYCCELPPGSGQQFHFMSDDDIEGKYEGIEL